MKSARFIMAGVLIVLSHVLMSAAQQGQGGWGGGNSASAGSWSSSNGQDGQPGGNGNSQTSYSYGGIDANGVPYGGYGGNGGYHVNMTDEHGHQHTFSGGRGGYAGAPGQPGQPGQPGYAGTHTYASTNTNRDGKPYASSSAYASAWGTFYIICLFSLFLIINS